MCKHNHLISRKSTTDSYLGDYIIYTIKYRLLVFISFEFISIFERQITLNNCLKPNAKL